MRECITQHKLSTYCPTRKNAKQPYEQVPRNLIEAVFTSYTPMAPRNDIVENEVDPSPV